MSDPAWPKFIRRMSVVFDDGESQPTTSRQQAPALPRRPPPNRYLYQPQPLWTEEEEHPSSSSSAAPPVLPARPTSVSVQELSQFMDAQQHAFDQARQQVKPSERPLRRNSLLRGSIKRPTALSPSAGGADDDRAPTTDRVAEFRLAIPDGVRCMTQHPEDTVVGSVVVTVTKPTKAQRITLRFLGQQRVHLRDPSQALSTHVTVDYTLFDKSLVLWGGAKADEDEAELETMPPGTLTLPFSIKLPRVNYPATVKRSRVCRVRYVVWAVFERPGTFVDHTVATAKEEILFEPIAYPTRTREPLSIDKTIDKPTAPIEAPGVCVRLSGAISQLPAMPGDRLLYNLEASVTSEHAEKRHVVKRMRLVFVEKLKMRGLIRGQEHTSTHCTDIHTAKLLPTSDKKTATATYASSVRMPLDMGEFDSKLVRRKYEARIECDVIDDASLLGKVTGQKATFVARVPLDVCDVSPDSFDSAAFMNAYTDDARNISSFAIPSHDEAAAEPELCKGGWELVRSYQKWNKHNECWRDLVEKKKRAVSGE